ncbi:MAG TPA: elongation factor 1-beta [Candidatus Nanoarchaeia archaeon]|nr:elongation factor 1-beta [Candidatus Nanoarchaeia archaeon]
MARIVVTLRIMPTSPEIDLSQIEEKSKKFIADFAATNTFKVEQKEVAFGLKSLNISFMMDENIGTTEPLEQKIATVIGVNSVEVTDVRRTIG